MVLVQNFFVVEKPPERANWYVRIGDFGISKRDTNGAFGPKTSLGTSGYQAPGILSLVNGYQYLPSYNNAIDLWALGVVIFNLITSGHLPFANSRECEAYYDSSTPFLNKNQLKFSLTHAGSDFLKGLLQPHPTRRLSACKALQHPWIRQESNIPNICELLLSHPQKPSISIFPQAPFSAAAARQRSLPETSVECNPANSNY